MSKTGPLRMQIGPIKARVTAQKDKAEALLAEPAPTNEAELRDYLERAERISKSLSNAKSKLQEKHDEWTVMVEELPDEQDPYQKSAEEIINIIFDGDEMLNAMSARENSLKAALQPQTVNAGSSRRNSDVQRTPSHPKAFKTEKIRLPTFSGDYMEFKQFWGLFEENIHKRDDLTNIEKFTYLLSQLQGDAKKALQGVMISNDNYDVAVALLKSRFDRADDRLVTMLYSGFMRIPISGRKIAEKQRTLDECERIFRQLETAGEDINSNRSLVCGILSKFPSDMVKDLQRYYNVGPNSELSDVRKGLHKSIAEEETTAGVIGDLQAMKFKDPNQPEQRHLGPQQYYGGAQGFPNSALHAGERQWNRRPNFGGPAQMLSPPGSCYFCGGNHFNGDCDKYTTYRTRLQRARELNRCTKCLRIHDPNIRCPIIIKCIHCRTFGRHVSAICHKRYPVFWQGQNQNNPQQPGAGGFQPPQPFGGSPGGHPNFLPPHQQNGRDPPNGAQPQPRPQNPNQQPHNDFVPRNSGGGFTGFTHSGVKPALFPTAKTVAVNPVTGQTCTVRLAMDTLSSRTYIRDPVAKRLGLVGDQQERLFVSVFGTNRTLEVPTSRVEFNVTLRDGRTVPIEANTTKMICQSGAYLNNWSEREDQALQHFRFSLADDPYDSDNTIDVLIGASLVFEFIDGPRFSTSAPGLFLIPTKFGLMLSGEAETDSDEIEPTMLCIAESPCQFPSELGLVACESKFEGQYPDIDEFWDLEKIGISDDPTECDDDKALEAFQKGITYVNGRYEVSLPWIEEKKQCLPSNYDMAYDRMRKLNLRLKANPNLLQGYRDILKLQKERGIIEEVSADEIISENTTHYLPHHPVLKPNSNTTKIRIVYDAAAKRTKHAVSLNECLLRGPVLVPDLCQLLMRMRVKETVVISDIEKAFLQVGLKPEDRDVTRFLWYKDDTNLCLTDNVAVLRFTRVNFGVISSPFLLAATLDHHLTLENSEFAESIRHDIYVDNVISGLEEACDPIEYYNSLKDLFQRAGMNIQEFCSNSKSLMDHLPESDRILQPDARVLGVKWDSQGDDTLRLCQSGKLISDGRVPTKRAVLKAIASFYDPLGFFQPILLPAKCFLQKLWKRQFDWDQVLLEDLVNEWNLLSASLTEIFGHRIPRYIGSLKNECTLVVFSDASARAYATTVYLRCRLQNGSWKSHLLFAKSRLAPSAIHNKKRKSAEKITLPRLELLGALIGVRAGIFCRNGFRMQDMKIDFFIDSQCVLHWISHKGMLKRFVANRVEEIRKTTNCAFHYVPTKDNPADYGTRGKTPDELLPDTLWWNGPQWLEKDDSTWPKSAVPPMSDEELREIQAETRPVFFGHALVAQETDPISFLAIEPSKFSTLDKLIRVSALCLKFLKRKVWDQLSDHTKASKQGLKPLFDHFSDSSEIASDEYDRAKLQWIKCVQSNHYSDILDHLTEAETRTSRPPQIVQQLGLARDPSGAIRCHGRLAHADLDDNSKNPLLLPKDDHFTVMVIQDAHDRSFHSGVSHTLCQTRLEYWIPHGRALTRKILRKCRVCRIFKSGRPFKLPPMPHLPKERVSQSAPFEHTGIDYFGPINVKIHSVTQKMWVCLFTCLSTRAVHLEAVMDFSAQEFMHCLIRFVSRRGSPKTIISDNAAQFQLVKILGDKAWKKTPTDESITAYAAKNGVKWKFITELAPWQGGFYERLVGLVKSTLKSSIRRKLLTWTDLVTLLTEAEAIVNSRPITYVNDDIDSRLRVLRPCDFLTPLPPALSDSADGGEVQAKDFGEAGKRLVAIWKQRCRTLEKLWKCWYDDYLLSLRERRIVSHKAHRSDLEKIPLVGQVVLITDPDAPRGQWKPARITKLMTSEDGRIRSAEVKLASGITLRRPLNRLVPLEVEDQDQQQSGDEDIQQSGPQEHAADPWFAQFANNDDEFLGFDASDVQRAVNALDRCDSDVAIGSQ